METKRILWADVAKGIGIMLVVFGHVPMLKGSWHNYIYCFHLPLFFVISGYFASIKENVSIKSIIHKQYKTLIIPYLFLSFWGLPKAMVTQWFHPEVFGATGWLHFFQKSVLGIIWGTDNQTPFSVPMNGPLWFIVALLLIRILFYLCAKRGRSFIILSVVFSITVTYIFSGYLKIGHYLPFSMASAIFAYPLYVVGYEVRKYDLYDRLLGLDNLRKVLLVICVFLFIWFTSDWNGTVGFDELEIGRNLFLTYCNGVVGTLGVILLSSLFERDRILLFFGRESLVFLGLQGLAICLIKYGLLYFLGLPVESYSIPVAIIITIVAMAMMSPIVIILNRICPSMLGRK